MSPELSSDSLRILRRIPGSVDAVMSTLRRRSFAGLIAAAAVAGCGSSEGAERTVPAESPQSKVLARSKLRGIGGPPLAQPPNQRYGFNGEANVTVELVRRGTDEFELIVSSDTIEVHTVVVADGTCAGYARTFFAVDAGEELFRERWLPFEGDAPGERRELPLQPDLAEALLARPLTVFADSGGAHGGEFQHCGPLQATTP